MLNVLRNHLIGILSIMISYVCIGTSLYLIIGDNVSNELFTYNELSKKYPEINFSDSREISLLKLFRDNSNLINPTNAEIDLAYEYLSNPKRYKKESYFEFSFGDFISIFWKSIWFYVSFFLICILTIYLSQSFGLIRFVFEKSDKTIIKAKIRNLISSIKEEPKNFDLWKKFFFYFFGSILLIILSLMMFTPAYVTAYSLKLDFVGNSLFIVVLLSIFSNTVLVFFIQKFYITLKKEYEKGYVTTAVMKGLNNEYQLNSEPFKIIDIFKPFRNFKSHAFQHVYQNSIYSFTAILKEAIPILLTSLIIVEMALNVQGSLCYELLVQLNDLKIVNILTIIFFIYVGLKIVEVCVDIVDYKIKEKYENN